MKRRTSKPSAECVLLRDVGPSALCALFDCVEGLQFWVKDREGRYRWVNRGFLLNYALDRREQVLGKTDYDLSPRHLADQFRQDDERVLAGRSILNRVELVGRFDHTAHWSVTNKVPLRDGRGRVTATAGITVALKEGREECDRPTLAMGKAIRFIRERCAEPISNQDLARVASLSVRAFERHFRREFHVSPRQYIRRLRVRMACHALVHTGRPLARIAADHGFCDQSHFTREFRRQTGQTPQRYRTRYRPAPA